MSSVKDAQTAANSQLAAVVSLQQQYSVLKSPQAENTQQIQTMKAQVQQQKMMLTSLEQAEQTYAQEYLDRKAAPSTTGFGLGSSQNWSITIFFIAYALCTLALLGVAVRYSYDDEKMKMAASVIMMSVIGALLIMRALMYAG